METWDAILGHILFERGLLSRPEIAECLSVCSGPGRVGPVIRDC